MFKWLKQKRDPSPYDQLRGSILANEDLAKVATYGEGTDDASSPWYHFAAAHRLSTTDSSAAQQHLRTIVELPEVESRTYLQAWHCLRTLGVEPDDSSRSEVNGIVVEVGLDAGVDSVAAYKDHSARYFNHGGASIIWDTESTEMNTHIDPLLEVAAAIGQNTAPHAAEHPPPPNRGIMLINILTPGGIHIGMGPLQAMQGDPMGAAAIQAALNLRQALIDAVAADGA